MRHAVCADGSASVNALRARTIASEAMRALPVDARKGRHGTLPMRAAKSERTRAKETNAAVDEAAASPRCPI
jgi:hypothetical protein